MEYYDKAGEIGSFFCDELYCKVSLYEDLGEYEKSVEMYMKIADTLRQRGYDVEADMAEKDAEENGEIRHKNLKTNSVYRIIGKRSFCCWWLRMISMGDIMNKN